MAKYLNLQVPQNCNEDWQSMLPDPKGKLCRSCQKTVTDFTKMTDQDLIQFFTRYRGDMCGRFSTDQLGRDILVPPKRIPWVKYFFMFTIPAFLMSIKSVGQGKNLKTMGEPTIEKVEGKTGTTAKPDIETNKTKFLKGQVLDKGGNPIPYATITIKNAKQSIAADSVGGFCFQNIELPTILLVSSVGYESQEKLLNSIQELYTIQLEMVTMGEVVVTGNTTQRKGMLMGSISSIKTYRKFSNPFSLASAKALQVYPNPAPPASAIVLQWKTLDIGGYLITIYSVGGQLVQSQQLVVDSETKSTSIRLHNLLAGQYFIKVSSTANGKNVGSKFVIQY